MWKLLHVLEALFTQIIIPPAVFDELTHPKSLAHAIEPEKLGFCQIVTPSDQAMVAKLHELLDPGEAEAIALAIELHADELLMDEKAGRRVAGAMHLKTTGVVALLVRAKQINLIPAVMPILNELHNQFQFHLASAMLNEARQLAGE